MNRIDFHDTHVYPGCLATFSFGITPKISFMSVVAEFSYGAYANAEVEQVTTGEVIVHIDSYTTVHGTNIPEKTWRLVYNDSQEIWKIVEKMDR